MKRNSTLGALAVLVSLALGSVLSWAPAGFVVGSDLPRGLTLLDESILPSVRGTYPGYNQSDVQCFCESQYENFVAGVVAACHCGIGNNGDTCVYCLNGTWFLSAYASNPGNITVMPSGGAGIQCITGGAEKWVGLCLDGVCVGAVDAHVTCSGRKGYPPFTTQPPSG